MMRIIISMLIYLISLLGQAQTAEEPKNDTLDKAVYSVAININKISSDKGKVYFALYDSNEGFNNKENLKTGESIIENGESKVVFEKLIPGIYAVVCFHDANDNGKMDFDSSGMPKEDYGMTNNHMSFGPPQFEEAKFELTDKDLTFEIKF